MTKLNYSVYYGRKNYLGEIHDKVVIAQFISKPRAMAYIAFCEQNKDETVVYGLVERKHRKEQ